MGDSGGSGLQGRKVAMVGRLASMDRAEAARRVTAAGGECVAAGAADLFVLGEGGGRRGDPTTKGETIDEAGFLALLGLGLESGPLYSTARLAALLELDPARLRVWVRQDLLRPTRVVGRLCLFDFRAVAKARDLARLCSSGFAAKRIRSSLDRARRWMPRGEAGPEVLEREAHAALAVRLDDGRLADPDGQLLMDFAGPPPSGAGATPMPFSSGPAAEEWFQRAVAAEAGGHTEEAATAYRRALEQAEEPETWFNLGNCLWTSARHSESAKAFRRAVELDPEYAEAWNNLGNVLGEMGDGEAAVESYRRALAVVPGYADAHFNLAETLSALGRLREALNHWRAFVMHDPNNPAAADVRARLEDQEE